MVLEDSSEESKSGKQVSQHSKKLLKQDPGKDLADANIAKPSDMEVKVIVQEPA